MSTDRRVALVGGTALLGPDLVPTPEAVVVIEGRAIAAVGPVDEVHIPDDIRTIDVAGETLMPGFIDAHVHIGLSDPREVLRRGVTSVRDLAWPSDEIFATARRSREPGFDGPAILAAGPMLTVADGYPITARWAPDGTGVAVRSRDHAAELVGGLASSGAAVIKVALNPQGGRVLPDDLLGAIVSAAHEVGLRVTAHIHGADQLRRGLDAGIDELAHMLMSPERLAQSTIDRMVDSAVTVVPTLAIFPKQEVDIAVDNLRRFITAGGRVVYGTDLGNEGPGPGIDASEVTRLEAAGLSVTDIVSCATVDAARWLGLFPGKGVLAPGSDADVVSLEAFPDTAAGLTRVRRVIREGRLVI